MQVAFWSNADKCGVTLATVVAAILGAGTPGVSITLYENRYHDANMGRLLLGSDWERMENWKRRHYSLDCMGADFLSKRTGKESEIPGMLSIISDRLYYKCSDNWDDRLYFEQNYMKMVYESERNFRRYIESGRSTFSFIDTQSRGNLSTKEILAGCDIAVVILPVKNEWISSYFREYRSMSDKSIFILNRYEGGHSPAPEEICSTYDIAPKRVLTVPYSEEARNAFYLGRITDFIKSNSDLEKDNENTRYISAMRHVFETIAEFGAKE